jgi:hypothetical protein
MNEKLKKITYMKIFMQFLHKYSNQKQISLAKRSKSNIYQWVLLSFYFLLKKINEFNLKS